VADETVEGVRNAEDGRCTAWDAAHDDAEGRYREEGRQLQGRCLTPKGVGQARNERTLKGSQGVHEDEPGGASGQGTAAGRTAFPVGNGEGVAGGENPMTHPTGGIQDSNAVNPMRGCLGDGDIA